MAQDEDFLSLSPSYGLTEESLPPQISSYRSVPLSIRVNQNQSENSFNELIGTLGVIVLGAVTLFCFELNQIVCVDTCKFQTERLILSILFSFPLLLIIFRWSERKLASFNLYFVNPNTELPIITSVGNSNSDSNGLHIATRLLHPRYDKPDITFEDRKNILDWLNTGDLKGLEINIIRAVVLKCFSEVNYLGKLLISFQLHRQQFLIYAALLFVTGWINFFENYTLPSGIKILLRSCGICWWFYAIYLYQVQTKNISQWLEKTRGEHLMSMHLPLFMWDPEKRKWYELSKNELHNAYKGDYGISTEKFITLTQSILLALYIAFVSFL